MTQDVFGQHVEYARRQLEMLSEYLRRSDAEPLPKETLQGLASTLEVLLLTASTAHEADEEKNRRRHRELFESAAEGYLMTDLDGVIQEANSAAAALLGANRALAGESLCAFVVEQEREAFCARLTQLRTRGDASSNWAAELRMRTGNTFLAELIVGVIHDITGQPVGLRWLLRDVTDRRQAEAVLRESQERFRGIFEQAAVGISHADLNGRYIQVNQKFCDIVGYTQAELRQLTFHEITHPDDLEADLAYAQQLLAGELQTFAMEKRYCRKDGSAIWVNLTVSLARDASGKPAYFIGVIEDITERKHAEAALRGEHDFASALVDTVGALVVVLDREGRIVRFNKTCERATGYSPEEVAGKYLWDVLLIPEEIETVKQVFDDLRSGRFPQKHENYWVARDGSRRLIDWDNTTLLDSTGAVEYVIGTGIDITERRRVEQALRDSEARFRLALKNAPVSVAVQDKDLRFIWAYNQRTARPEDVVGKTDTDVFVPEDAARLIALKRQALETGKEIREQLWLNRAGGPMYVDLYLEPMRDEAGRVVGVGIATVDLTERIHAEEALRQRNHEMALLNSAVRTLTSTLDLHKVLFNIMEELARFLNAENCSAWLVDPATGEMVCHESTGSNRETVRGWRLAPNQGVVGWVAQHSRSLVVSDTRDDEHHYKGVDNKTGVEMRSILCVPLWVRPDVIGVLEVTDTEANHFTEADLRKVEPLAATAATAIANARLYETAQQEIAERSRAEETLRRHAAELQARNEELDAFAHTVAHDLKNPLSIIVGFAESLESDYALLPSDVLYHHLHSVSESARKMVSITDELLLLAGVRKLDVRAEPLDMASIVSEVFERLTPIITAAQAKVVLPAAWPAAKGHAPWVEQVWVNYISNALQYGGQPPHLELGATPLPGPLLLAGGGMVRFWVRDNGHGLTPEDQARLFTPFTRLEQVRAKGHGLGLSIVRRIVEKLGGQVGVESRIGEGSTFFFTLPSVAG